MFKRICSCETCAHKEVCSIKDKLKEAEDRTLTNMMGCINLVDISVRCEHYMLEL